MKYRLKVLQIILGIIICMAIVALSRAESKGYSHNIELMVGKTNPLKPILFNMSEE